MSDVAHGWSFLLQFGTAIVLLCASAAIWREWIRRWNYCEGSERRLLDQYEHAWLQFGRRTAIQRVVVNLLRKGNLRLDPVDPQRVHLQDFDGVVHPLEIDVLDLIARFGTLQIDRIHPAVITSVTPYCLARAGLIPQPGTKWLLTLPAVIVVSTLLCVGLGETGVRMAANQSASLVLLLTAAGIAGFIMLCLPPRRTVLGDAVLKRLQETADQRRRVSFRLANRLGPATRKIA